jgi:SMI1 / KNR4 family (SUKH-1)
MSTLEQLAAWKIRKWMPWGGSYPSKPATQESVARIESALKFKVPVDFVEFSRLVHNYGVWFGSIGEDYASHNHLLVLNEAFHQAEDSAIALPEHWVLINHGHDGDCDCFDITAGKDGEYPIYYVNVESPGAPQLLASTFKEYLVKLG